MHVKVRIRALRACCPPTTVIPLIEPAESEDAIDAIWDRHGLNRTEASEAG
jgi:hypothetical protein